MIETKVQVNKVYLPYVQAESPRTQIFYGGSSSGKSVFIAQRAVLDVLRGGRNYLVVRKVAKTLRASAFTEITKVILETGLFPFFRINKSAMTIHCYNGYQLLFAGLDDVEKLKSITTEKDVLTDIWLEEATEMEESDVIQLHKRLRGTSKYLKRVTMTFNPILKNHWIHRRYFHSWDDTKRLYQDAHILILKTTYKDNNFLTQDDIDALENEDDKYYYEVYTLGNWGILGAVIFKNNYKFKDLSKIKHQFDNLRFGLDFGFSSHPAAMTCCHYDKNKKIIYIYDEFYLFEHTNDMLAAEVLKKAGNNRVTADSAEPKSIREIRNLGVNAYGAKKGKDSIIYGIQWLQQHVIIIDIRCINTRNEVQQYKWREDKYGIAMPYPVDKNNHIIDGIRYAFEDDMEIRNRMKVISKRAVGL